MSTCTKFFKTSAPLRGAEAGSGGKSLMKGPELPFGNGYPADTHSARAATWWRRCPYSDNWIEIGDLRELWDPSLDPASCCGNADWADVDDRFWDDRRPYKGQADDTMQKDNLADGCGESDDKDAGDEKSDDDGEDEEDDNDDEDEVISQSSEDSLSLNRSRGYDIESPPHSAGVGLEFFHTIKGKGCVFCNDLPPTIPGLTAACKLDSAPLLIRKESPLLL